MRKKCSSLICHLNHVLVDAGVLMQQPHEGGELPGGLGGGGGEPVHVVLGLYPRVYVPGARAHQVTSEVLAVHVVEELGHGRHVEDVEV